MRVGETASPILTVSYTLWNDEKVDLALPFRIELSISHAAVYKVEGLKRDFNAHNKEIGKLRKVDFSFPVIG